MVRYLVLLGFLLAVFACCCQADFTKAQKRLTSAMFDECCEDLDIPLNGSYFEKAHYNNVKWEDGKGPALIFCTMLRLEFTNCEGTIDKQALVDYFTDGHDVATLPGVVDECDRNKEGNSTEERSYSFYRCFFEQKKFNI